jgi:hypothetical protein
LLAAGECGNLSAMSKAEAIYDKVRALPETAQAAVLHVVESLAVGQASSAPNGSQTLGITERFQELAEIWKRETRYLSFMEQRAMHPAYQGIIGMGWVAIPLILRELQTQPEHWLWALKAITGEDLVGPNPSMETATEAWLKWGQEQGLLADANG